MVDTFRRAKRYHQTGELLRIDRVGKPGQLASIPRRRLLTIEFQDYTLVQERSVGFGLTYPDVKADAERLALERGERIRRARKAAGLTLDEVSKDIGMSRATLWKWETGRTESYDAVLLLWLARRLSTTHEWILFGTADSWAAAPPPIPASKKRRMPPKDGKP